MKSGESTLSETMHREEIVAPPTPDPKKAQAAPSQAQGFLHEPNFFNMDTKNEPHVYHDNVPGTLTVLMKERNGTSDGVLTGVRFDASDDSRYRPLKSYR